MKRQFFGSFFIAFFLLFSACIYKTEDNFKDKLLPKNCDSSCWLGILPGSTTYVEAKNIISNYYGDDYVELISANSKIIQWYSEDDALLASGNVTFADGIAYDLYIFFRDTELLIDDFINEIGEPHSVSITIGDGCAGASLYYPDFGLVVFPTNYYGIIDKEIEQYITGVKITEPWDQDVDPYYDSYQVIWSGYGDYCPEKWPWEE